MTAYMKMQSTRGNKIFVSVMLYTLINLLLHPYPQNCWETRADSTMPGQAVSPQAVDIVSIDQIKKTQRRQPDTGSLSTQLSRRATHRFAHTNSQHLCFALPIQFPALRHTPHIGRQESCQPSSHHAATRPDYSAELPSLSLILLTLCRSNRLSGL